VEISNLSRGGATYATYKSHHFKSWLFGFTDNLFYTFCTLSHPTYGNERWPKLAYLCYLIACFLLLSKCPLSTPISSGQVGVYQNVSTCYECPLLAPPPNPPTPHLPHTTVAE
jgi:hypothetical protein